MAASLLALLDDIASVLDDVALMTKVAARKSAAAADDEHVVHALLAQQVHNLREEMRMCTRENAHRNDVHVLLQSCLGNLLGGLTKACVNDLESCIAQGAGDDLRAAVMTIFIFLLNGAAATRAACPHCIHQYNRCVKAPRLTD